MDDLERRLREHVRSVAPVGPGEARERAVAQARGDRRRRRLAVSVGAAVALVAAGASAVALARRPGLGVDVGSSRDGARYEVDATVIDAGAGPVACAEVLASRPPSCGAGWPVQGLDWEEVDSETANGVRWGELRLVGTWNGHRLVLVEPPGPAAAVPPDDGALRSPCSATANPLDDDTIEQLHAVVKGAPELAGFWVDPESGNVNVAFAGDIRARRQALAEQYGDAVCVVQRDASLETLRAVEAELAGAVANRDHGLYLVSIDEAAGTVVAHVAVADDATRRFVREVSSRPDLVRIAPFLQSNEE
jgi:hypothetical protein